MRSSCTPLGRFCDLSWPISSSRHAHRGALGVGHDKPESAVTINQNGRSRSAGIAGHDKPESPVTTNRNDRSRSTRIPNHHLPLRLVVHLVDVIQALGAIEVLSMRMKPGRPWDAGALRTPMVTALVDRVLTSTTRWARYGALLRRLYRWATEIEPRRTNRTSRKASRWRRSTQAVAGIGSHRPARPRRPRCSAERRRVRGRDIA